MATPRQQTSKTKIRNGGKARAIKPKPFPIVAIGGSAGSFQSLEKFFTHMPSDSGMAFIVVMHLDNNHQGIAELIQNYTPMEVIQAEDGMPVEPNTVYTIPPNKDMGVHNRKLLLLPPAHPKGYRLPIDYFLQSLAEDQWNKAVAVIFSGMGSDGETGIRMIKEKLGMAMVQDPETALYDSMPRASIETNLVDYVLSPEEMPIKLIQYLNHPAISEVTNEQLKSDTKEANAIQKILMLLRSHTGHDFAHYKKNTITRRIDRRLAFHQLPDYGHYINFLRENPQEIDVLFNELLIGVTKFFRDAHAFDSLKEKLFKLLSHKTDGDPIRVWVAGCSTGEEAYSVAILIMEYFEHTRLKKLPKVQIFSTDLDMEAIEHARVGIYYENIIADVSPERLNSFFIKKDDTYSVRKELREMIVFAQHNLIKDAPFTRLDLLCCRNVMIYLTAELQKKIIPIFHYSLNNRGILFMGPAETIGGFSEMFNPIDPKWKLFERKEGSAAINKMIDFPFNVTKQSLTISKVEEGAKNIKKKTLAESFNKILLETYTPASILINDKGDILYINGRTGKFLELNSGEAVMNIYQMAKEELRYAMSNAIHQARTQKAIIQINDIKVKEEDHVRLVDIKVNPLQETALQGLILIIFEDKGILKKQKRNIKKLKDPEQKAAMEELEKELLYTKQQLHTTIEQMETSLEELKSTNEELQSTNEELQSTNEESLTTKEEMQSLNEELMTINVQFQAKADELTQLNNDMKNLLDNTEIGTIFLDNELVILRFTPQVKKLFNVIATDVGRSITDIAFNFDYPNLEETIRQVTETLVAKEAEIKTKKNEWYNLRIMPYRTLDNFINGAVLTFTKITLLKSMEHKLNTLNEYAESIVNAFPQPALMLDKNLNVSTVNKMFYDYFKIKQNQFTGMAFSAILHEIWKTAELDKMIKKLDQDISMTIEQEFPRIGRKKLEVTARPSIDKETNKPLQVLIILTELK
ncbi:CheR family methyltransferase [Mucilaginibacter panaciglaebae]|uniref:protein-glutamate O-methyltransferase n=1 Tax=Mucilaginibacter panaciglaebae TaxID=502331 RepID=A0ABP7X4S3_9SPHI